MSLTKDDIEFLVELEEGVARPGQRIRGGFRLKHEEPLPVKRVETSLLWYTAGKGNQDEEIIWHQTTAENDVLDAQRAIPFEAELPERPWSYAGKLIKINWVIRARIFPENGEEIAADYRFQLLPEGRS